jgi:hypothetical protein
MVLRFCSILALLINLFYSVSTYRLLRAFVIVLRAVIGLWCFMGFMGTSITDSILSKQVLAEDVAIDELYQIYIVLA